MVDIVHEYQEIKDCWTKDEDKDWGSLINSLIFAFLVSETVKTADMFKDKKMVEAGVYIIPSNLISFHDIVTPKLGKFNIFRGGQ